MEVIPAQTCLSQDLEVECVAWISIDHKFGDLFHSHILTYIRIYVFCVGYWDLEIFLVNVWSSQVKSSLSKISLRGEVQVQSDLSLLKDPSCDLSPLTVLISLQERTAVLSELAQRANLTEQMFNTVPGITCNPVQGAMYTFPRITLPQKAINKAKVCTTHPPTLNLIFTNLFGYAQMCLYIPRRKAMPQTCSSVWGCWRRRVSAWCQVVALAREKEPSTSGQYC